MSNIDRMIDESKDFKEFARGYAGYICTLLQKLDVDALAKFSDVLQEARHNQKTIFIAGNGGSAGTASHMANDLGFGVRQHIDPPLKVMALTDNVPVITAVANDVGYDQVFLRQLQVYFKSADGLIVISASGNSPNLVLAAQWVKKQGGKVLGLLGFDGGQLKDICDVAVIVQTPKGEYGPVEDVHMILDHLLHAWLWSKSRRTACAESKH